MFWTGLSLKTERYLPKYSSLHNFKLWCYCCASFESSKRHVMGFFSFIFDISLTLFLRNTSWFELMWSLLPLLSFSCKWFSENISLRMSHKCLIPPDWWSNMFVNAVISMLQRLLLMQHTCQHINSHVIWFLNIFFKPFTFCSPQFSSWFKTIGSAGSVAKGDAPSCCAAGLHPDHRHGGRTQFCDLCALQARPLLADWQIGPPSRPHPQLQRHPALPHLAGSNDQVLCTQI